METSSNGTHVKYPQPDTSLPTHTRDTYLLIATFVSVLIIMGIVIAVINRKCRNTLHRARFYLLHLRHRNVMKHSKYRSNTVNSVVLELRNPNSPMYSKEVHAPSYRGTSPTSLSNAFSCNSSQKCESCCSCIEEDSGISIISQTTGGRFGFLSSTDENLVYFDRNNNKPSTNSDVNFVRVLEPESICSEENDKTYDENETKSASRHWYAVPKKSQYTNNSSEEIRRSSHFQNQSSFEIISLKEHEDSSLSDFDSYECNKRPNKPKHRKATKTNMVEDEKWYSYDTLNHSKLNDINCDINGDQVHKQNHNDCHRQEVKEKRQKIHSEVTTLKTNGAKLQAIDSSQLDRRQKIHSEVTTLKSDGAKLQAIDSSQLLTVDGLLPAFQEFGDFLKNRRRRLSNCSCNSSFTEKGSTVIKRVSVSEDGYLQDAGLQASSDVYSCFHYSVEQLKLDKINVTEPAFFIGRVDRFQSDGNTEMDLTVYHV